jgi:uncharacterized membrane protein YczE
VHRRVIAAAVGWPLMGLGVSLLVAAGRGVAPMDVLNSGLASVMPIQVGTANWLVTAVCVVIALALGTRPRWGTLFCSFTVGLVINLALPILGTPENFGMAYLQSFSGMALLLIGAMLAIASEFGPGPVELTMLAIHHRGVPLRPSRWIVEGSMFTIGLILGGQVGWMSLFVVLLSAPVMAYVLPHVRQLVIPADVAV